ncbi:MAG: hypothetical protein V7603_5117 [Micromonosporaceae bacterium]
MRPAGTEIRIYTPPTVKAIQCRDWPTEAVVTGHQRAGWALRVELNTRTGVFKAEPNEVRFVDKSNDRHRGGDYYLAGWDLWVRGWQWDRVPTWIAWEVSNVYDGHWALSAEGVNAMLDRLAGHAQTLVNALIPISGTNGEYDWSLLATAAHERIGRVIDRFPDCQIGGDANHPYFGDIDAPLPERHHYGVVTFAELLAVAPDLVDPAWAVMSDAELDEVAAPWTGTASVRHRTIPFAAADAARERYFPREPGAIGNHGLPIYIIAARSGLREYRAAATAERTGLPAVDACTLDLVLPETLTSDVDDAGLARMAAELEAAAAHNDKIALVGLLGELRRQRAHLRQLVRAEAAAVGARTTAAEADLKTLRATRAGLLGRVIGWGEEPEWKDGEVDYAELGRLGHMSRQGARQLVTNLTADDTPDPEQTTPPTS